MDAKIQELTEKIYNEGVERGQTEAQRLIAEAETKAKTIEADAQARAAALITDAERRAKELKENTQSELRLYSAQLVDSLRSSIADQIQGEVADQNTKALAVDPQFIQGLVARIVEGFDLNRGVEIATADAEALRSYFASNAKQLLEQGVSIRSVAGKPTDFTISPKDGRFKIQFGEAEFAELFKSFLRPELSKMLF